MLSETEQVPRQTNAMLEFEQTLKLKGYDRVELESNLDFIPQDAWVFKNGHRYCEVSNEKIQAHVSMRIYKVRFWACMDEDGFHAVRISRLVGQFMFSGSYSEIKTILKRLMP